MAEGSESFYLMTTECYSECTHKEMQQPGERRDMITILEAKQRLPIEIIRLVIK